MLWTKWPQWAWKEVGTLDRYLGSEMDRPQQGFGLGVKEREV